MNEIKRRNFMGDKKRVVIVVSEGTFDKGMMSMIIANSAASMDMEVHVFFNVLLVSIY